MTQDAAQPASSSEASKAPSLQTHAMASPIKTFRRPWTILLFVVLVTGLLAADLAIKYWSFEHVAGVPVVIDKADPGQTFIPMHQPRPMLPHILSMTLTLNQGAVFGLGQGARPVFITVSLIATTVVLTLFLRSPANARAFHLGLALLLGGALGNLYDRVVYRAVRDMFYLFPNVDLPLGLTWPGGMRGLYPWIFNFADVALVVGMILLAILSWRYDTQRQKAAKAQG